MIWACVSRGFDGVVGYRLCVRSLRTLAAVGLQVLAIALIGLVVFAVTSPFLMIDFARFQSSLGYIFQHLAAPSSPEIGWIRLVRLGLWYGLDPPLFILGCAGLIHAVMCRSPAAWLLS